MPRITDERKAAHDASASTADGSGKGKQLKKWVKVLLIALCVLLTSVAGAGIYALAKLNQLSIGSLEFTPMPTLTPNASVDIDTEESTSPQTSAQTVEVMDGVFSMMMLGVDTRDLNELEGSRTDTMMLITIDPQKKQIKMVSFMRDTLVAMDGYGKNRLNTAFRFGGYPLLNNTISNYFGISTDNYAVVNFYGVIDIVNIIGGMDVDIKREEITAINECIDEVNTTLDKAKRSQHLTKDGVQHLDGGQVLAYSRIRHVGNGDFDRTNRQRVVMSLLIDEMKQFSLPQMLALIDKAPSFVRTNITAADMLKLANTFLEIKNGLQIEQLRLPADGAYTLSGYNGMSGILVADPDKNSEILNEFLNK